MDTDVFDRSYFHGSRKNTYANYADTKQLLMSFAKILNYTFRPTTAFDAGGAYGHLVHGLRRRGVKSWGMDVSPYAVQHSPFMRVGDVTAITDQEVYDLVTCNDVLEHIPEPLIQQTLQGLWRVTGKYLVLIIAIAEYPFAHLDATHVTVKPKQWWEELFENLSLPRCLAKEQELNAQRLCKKMLWAGRIFVFSREIT